MFEDDYQTLLRISSPDPSFVDYKVVRETITAYKEAKDDEAKARPHREKIMEWKETLAALTPSLPKKWLRVMPEADDYFSEHFEKDFMGEVAEIGIASKKADECMDSYLEDLPEFLKFTTHFDNPVEVTLCRAVIALTRVTIPGVAKAFPRPLLCPLSVTGMIATLKARQEGLAEVCDLFSIHGVCDFAPIPSRGSAQSITVFSSYWATHHRTKVRQSTRRD